MTNLISTDFQTVRQLLNDGKSNFWVWYPKLNDWIVHQAADFSDPDHLSTYANHRAVPIYKPQSRPT